VRRAADTAAAADLGARLPAALGATLLVLALSGCAVVTVAGAAVSVGAAVVGTAVDVTVGAAKLTGKAVGSAVDAMTDDDVEQAPAEPQPAK
jgi:hypothetical protein